MSPLSAAIRQKAVEEVLEIHDYHQLFFEGGVILSICNPFRIEPSSAGNFQSLKGRQVEDVQETEEAVIIQFSNRLEMKIDLRRHVFHGAEALVLISPGEPIVVWN